MVALTDTPGDTRLNMGPLATVNGDGRSRQFEDTKSLTIASQGLCGVTEVMP
jgi:hypothetical protein